MYNNMSYEEYMRIVLGYNPGGMDCMPDTYEMNNCFAMPNCEQYYCESAQNNDELEKLYPEIYLKLYPTVCKVCSQCTARMSQEMLEKMTDEVYDTVYVVEVRKDEKRETRQRDNTLRDLIKILILRELLGPGFPGHRPPRPRPPFPGPGPRPPMPPRPPFPRPR